MPIGPLRNPSVRVGIATAILLTAFAAIATIRSGSGTRPVDVAHWAQVNGHPMYYEIHGSGPALLMLHGGGDSVQGSFARQIGFFSRDYRVIAPEQVGQGHTPDVTSELSYSQMTEDTASLMRQLGIRSANVIGWSDGGNIALMLAARHPDLVQRVVISGANISPDGLRSGEIETMRAAIREIPVDQQSIDDKLNTLWLTSPTPNELSVSVLSQIRQPVLVMSGDRDVIRLEHTLQIYHALPHAELYVLPDTQHGTFAERPQWINPVLQWFLNSDQTTVAAAS